MVRETHRGNSVINQPAGHVERGETLVQAVRRETLEETGWKIEPSYLSGIYQFNAASGDTYFRFTFFSKVVDEVENPSLDPAIEEVLWLDRKALEEMHSEHRSDVVLQCIDDYEKGNRLPLECVKSV